jgi:hypothetical protein
VCRELIARSADVKAVSLLKTNALHFAAKCRDVHSRGDVYDLLLKAGADESAKDGDGKTPKELFVEAQTKGIAADDGGDVAAEEANKKNNNEPKLVETVYVDEQVCVSVAHGPVVAQLWPCFGVWDLVVMRGSLPCCSQCGSLCFSACVRAYVCLFVRL